MKKRAKLFALISLLLASCTLFAVDGIITKSRSNKSSSFSNMKKNLTLSLHSGFVFKDNRILSSKVNGREGTLNSVITYQKGNISYIIPYRNKAILQKFATPQKPIR